MKTYNVAIVGATGAVGQEILKILEERKFPVKNLKLLASDKSIGKSFIFNGKNVPVDVLDDSSFKDVEIALFSAGGDRSLRYAPVAAKAGAIVIDNTSAFRMDPEIPLIVPEVNAHAIEQYENKGIIANPNCSTIQMVVALKPIHDEATIKRVVVSTYQSVSGAGLKAMEELSTQTISLLTKGSEVTRTVFPHRIAFNILPHIDKFADGDYTKEEIKMINETRKIMEADIKVSATTARVPVFYSHAEAVNIETEKKITAKRAREVLEKFSGITVYDDPSNTTYPTPLTAQGKDDVYVGRIREDKSIENGLDMWVVADNIRKGAALNAVQIAEILVDKYI